MSLKEVARRAHVSTATVSRVLNGVDVVKNSTRTRVMKAISELNYHPNLHARSLAAGGSRTLGVIVSNLENPFFLDVYRALEADCHAHGYEIVVANTGYRSEQLVASVRLMIGRRVSGLAAIVSEMDHDLIRELLDSRIPVVFYDVGPTRQNITNIRVNYRKGVERIVEHLFALGHAKIAFVGHHSALGPIDERRSALFEALRRQRPSAEVEFFAAEDSLEGGADAARQLLAGRFPATAVICVNDLMAVGVLKQLREQRIRVPEDISVTGFDNITLSRFCFPPLTTVDIPRDRIGHILYAMLCDPEAAIADQREVVIQPEFVIRESTGPARPAARASDPVALAAAKR